CWLGPAQVETEPRAAGNVRHHAVEHLLTFFVAVETVIQERPQESAALRRTERDGLRRVHERIRRSFHPRRDITECRHAKAGNGKLLWTKGQLIRPSRCEAAGERDSVAFHRVLAAVDD